MEIDFSFSASNCGPAESQTEPMCSGAAALWPSGEHRGPTSLQDDSLKQSENASEGSNSALLGARLLQGCHVRTESVLLHADHVKKS